MFYVNVILIYYNRLVGISILQKREQAQVKSTNLPEFTYLVNYKDGIKT